MIVRIFAVLWLVVVAAGAVILTMSATNPASLTEAAKWVNDAFGTQIPTAPGTYIPYAVMGIICGALGLWAFGRDLGIQKRRLIESQRQLLIGIAGLKFREDENAATLRTLGPVQGAALLADIEARVKRQVEAADSAHKLYSDAIDKVMTRVGAINELLAVARRRIATIHERGEHFGSEIHRLGTELGDLKAGVEALEERTSAKELAGFEKDMGRVEERIVLLEGLSDRIAKALPRANALLERVRKIDPPEMGESIDELERKTTEIDEAFGEVDDGDLQSDLDQEIKFLNGAEKDAQGLEELKPKIAAAEERAGKLNVRVDAIMDDEDGVRALMDGLQEKTNEIENRLGNIEHPEDLSQELDRMLEKLDDQAEILAQLEAVRARLVPARDRVEETEAAAHGDDLA